MSTIHYTDILEIQLSINGNDSSIGKIVGGAIVLGTAGALLGSISANTINSIDLIFNLNSVDKHSSYIHILLVIKSK